MRTLEDIRKEYNEGFDRGYYEGKNSLGFVYYEEREDLKGKHFYWLGYEHGHWLGKQHFEDFLKQLRIDKEQEYENGK